MLQRITLDNVVVRPVECPAILLTQEIEQGCVREGEGVHRRRNNRVQCLHF
jgi:hypothetical protein